MAAKKDKGDPGKDGDAAKPAKGGLLGAILPLLILTAAGGGAGFFAGLKVFEAPHGAAAVAAAPAADGHKDDVHGAAKGGDGHGAAKGGDGHGAAKGGHGEAEAAPVKLKLVPMPTVLTNLASPSSTYIRVEGSVLVDESAPEAAAMLAKIGEDIIALVRTLTLTDIEGASGFMHLREDINERVVARSEGKAREFILSSMVVE